MCRQISALVAALSLVAVAVVPQPAAAKGLFESLLGFFSSKPSAPAPNIISRPGPDDAGAPGAAGRRNPFENGASGSPMPDVGGGGRYKTVCVRLCDGYFFPISNSSRRRDFYNDAQQCQSQCDSETRLYYTSPMASSINGARDQGGLAYDKLKTAFLYRKKLVQGCACRPKPWSVAERLRHQTYEMAAKEGDAGLAGDGPQTPHSVVGVQPNLIAEDAAVPAATGLLRPEAYAAVPRRVDWSQAAAAERPRRVVERPQPKSSGLGAVFPPVKYKHRWPGDTN